MLIPKACTRTEVSSVIPFVLFVRDNEVVSVAFAIEASEFAFVILFVLNDLKLVANVRPFLFVMNNAIGIYAAKYLQSQHDRKWEFRFLGNTFIFG